MIKNILIIGAGYVGTSISVLLGQTYKVTILDKDKTKLDLINAKKSPIKDKLIQDFLDNKSLNLETCSNIEDSIKKNPDLIILCLPTNYNYEKNYFDTKVVEDVIQEIYTNNSNSPILIKSTLPIGFTYEISKKYHDKKIIFSPEFLREGNALYDNLYPSRIIIGENGEFGKKIANIFYELAQNKPKIFLMNSSEAEAVKLFANSYLANRVSFFNELDSFCIDNNLDPISIIEGVSSDFRIGNEYNNPSFGYGGYCLPKDSKQLLASFKDTPQNLFSAIVESNKTRKKFIVNNILKFKPKVVGVYRLVMKTDSDNFRDSAVFDIAKDLISAGVSVIAYEPFISEKEFKNITIINSLKKFKEESEIIIANRMSKSLDDVISKVFTRDIDGKN